MTILEALDAGLCASCANEPRDGETVCAVRAAVEVWPDRALEMHLVHQFGDGKVACLMHRGCVRGDA